MIQSKIVLAGVLTSLLFATACSPLQQTEIGPDNDSIIGGSPVEKTDPLLRSVVAVYDSSSAQLCTGSILPHNMILTAAHCIGNGPMYIFFDNILGGTSQRRLADVVLVSPFWAKRSLEKMNTSDIAILHFQGDLPSGYKPAKMLTDKKVLQKGLPVVVVGFGISDGVSGEGAGILRSTSLPIADPDFSVSEIKLDQTQGTGVCHGDSGGPAYVKNAKGELLLWGITSRGTDDSANDCSKYSVFTSALYYKEFIQAGTEKILAYLKEEAAKAPAPTPTPSPSVTPSPKPTPTPSVGDII